MLLSENRPHWLIADIAIMNSGGVTVPLFTTYSDSDYEYIINDCGPKVCIVSNKLQYEKIEKFLNNNIKIISIDEITDIGIQKVWAHDLELTDLLIEGVLKSGLEIASPTNDEERSSIVSIKIPENFDEYVD